MRIIVGLLIVAAGVLIIRYADRVVEGVGASAFGEKYFRSSESFYKFIGVIVIFVGMMVTTGLIESFILGIFGPLFRGFQPA